MREDATRADATIAPSSDQSASVGSTPKIMETVAAGTISAAADGEIEVVDRASGEDDDRDEGRWDAAVADDADDDGDAPSDSFVFAGLVDRI